MCFQGVWFVSAAANGPWEVASTVPQEIYDDPGELVGQSRHLRDGRRQRRRVGDLCDGPANRHDGRVGLHVWGTGYYYPPYYGFYGGYPYLFPAASRPTGIGLV